VGGNFVFGGKEYHDANRDGGHGRTGNKANGILPRMEIHYKIGEMSSLCDVRP